MNAPAPGWHPDPTSRHDYRYWDGWQWTDDVSDGRLTAIDPLPPTEPDAAPATRVARADPYAGWDSDDWRPPRYPYPTSGEVPPRAATKKGPSTRLLVGVGLVAVALIAGLAFVLVSDAGRSTDGTEVSGGREPASAGSAEAGDTTVSSQTTTTTAPAAEPPGGTEGSGSGSTGPGGTNGSGGGSSGPSGSAGSGGSGGTSTTATAGGPGPGGGPPGIDTSSEEAMVDSMANMFQQSSGGQVSDEQARCMAEGMLETLGPEGLTAMMGGGGTPPSMTPQDYQALQQLAVECGMAQSPTG